MNKSLHTELMAAPKVIAPNQLCFLRTSGTGVGVLIVEGIAYDVEDIYKGELQILIYR